VRAGWALFTAGFRRYSSYRAATVAGVVTNSVFGILKASVYVAAVASAGGSLGGYDAKASVTFAWLTQALIAPVHMFTWTELAQRVRTGDVAIDLARPLDLQMSWLATDLGRAAFVLVPRGLPPLLVAAVTFGLTLPAAPLPYLLGALSIVLAVGISFACRFAINLTSLWLIEIRGVNTIYLGVSTLLSGLFVPVRWFPPWLRALAAGTPFPSLLQTPVDLIMGRRTGWAAALVLGVQLLWLAATLALGRVVLARAVRKVVVQGG
jgi:viologen exporter family transport system permease protein